MAIYNGSARDDVLNGTGLGDVFNAGEGNNMIRALGGHNLVFAGRGNDRVTLGSGNDVINVGDGNNIVDAGDGHNTVNSGSGDDQVRTGVGNDVVHAGDGANDIAVGDGNNLVTAGSGNDRITSGADNDTIYAGDGANIVDAGGGNNLVYTGSGADRITAGAGVDAIYAGEGDDWIDAGGGNDLVYLGGGNDSYRYDVVANAGARNDLAFGDAGTDTLQLVLTAEQTASAAILADIARFNAAGGGKGAAFKFNSFGLTASSFERIVIVAPVDAVDDAATTSEDAAVTIAVLANDRDFGADTGAALRVAGYNAAGLPGTLTLGADNRFIWNPGAAYQYLAIGETATATFTYTLTDDQGYTDIATVRLTITGTNDGPVFGAGADRGDVVEGKAVTTGGSIAFGDVDRTDAHGVSVAAAAGGYLGTFTARVADASTGDGAGRVDWAFAVDPAAIAALRGGEVRTQDYQLTLSDGKGGIAVRTVTVTLTGTNDAPIAAGDVGRTTEDAALVVDVLANDSDPNGDALTLVSVTAPVGRAEVRNNSVAWDPGTAFDYLAAGQTAQVTLRYVVRDPDGATATASVVVTVTGTNDAAVLTSQAVTLIEGDVVLTTAGQLAISDVDSPATFQSQTARAGQFGTFAIDEAGRWTYATSDAVDRFVAGQSYLDRFVVRAADGTETSVTVTINGTNDAALLSSASVALTEGDDALSTGGRLSIVDVDSPAVFVAQATQGRYGAFAIDAAGAWTYSAPAHNEFAAGTNYVDSFTVASVDGTTTTVTVTIAGTNDAAVLSSASERLIEGDAPLSTGGRLTITDVDSPAAFVPQAATSGRYGTFAIDAAGTWTYTAPAHDEFAAGTDHVDAFTVASVDGTTTLVTVTITGTNDAAVLSNASVEVAEGNGPFDTSGRLTITDVDSPATFAPQTDTHGQFGLFSIATDGTWHYRATVDVDALAVGDTITDTFPVRSADGTQTSVTVTINGTNDGPVVISAAADANGAAREAGMIAGGNQPDAGIAEVGGTLAAFDADARRPLVWAGSADGLYGRFEIAADGIWRYRLDNESVATQALAAGNTVFDRFTATVTDEHGDTATQVVDVAVAGTNDAPVAVVLTGDRFVADRAPTTVAVPFLDPDAGDAVTLLSATASEGSVAIGPVVNGQPSLVFDPGDLFAALPDGATRTVDLAYTGKDLSGAEASGTVTVTVVGTNDAPIVSGPVTDQVTEGGSASVLNALANASDVDTGATLLVVPPEELPPGVSYDPTTRSFRLDPTDASLSDLRAGQTREIVVGYGISDGIATTAAEARWTVTGIDTKPTLDLAVPAPVAQSTAISRLFALNGTAYQYAANEVQLTRATTYQQGSAFSQQRLDLTQSFTFSFSVYLGTRDAGADGISLILHNDPFGAKAIGEWGEGLGALGISKGIAIEFDTYYNSTQPGELSLDHTAILRSSDFTPLTAVRSLGNVEDGRYHDVVLRWNAATKTLSYTFDGASTSLTNDLAQSVFGGNEVWFGFAASTGGEYNDQRVKINALTGVLVDSLPDANVEYGAGNAAVALLSSDLAVTDGGERDLARITVQLTDLLNPARERVSVGGAGFTLSTSGTASVTVGDVGFDIAYNAGTKTFTIIGSNGEFGAAAAEAVLRSLTYASDAGTPLGNRGVSVTVVDAAGTAATALTNLGVVLPDDGVRDDVLPGYLPDLVLGDRAVLSAQNGAPVSSQVLPTMTRVAIGDFDFDGDADVVGIADGRLVFLGNTGGVLTPVTPTPNLSGLTGLTDVGVGDFDGDGRDDVIVARSAGSPLVLRTISAFGFAAPAGVASGARLVVGEVNGDGFDDIVTLTAGGFNIVTNARSSTGTAFGTAGQVALTGIAAVALGDVNNDGFIDVVGVGSGSGSQGSAVMALGSVSGAGAYSVATASRLGLTGIFTAISIADVDGDGLLDLLLGTVNGVRIAYNSGPQTGSNVPTFRVADLLSGGGAIAAVTTADLNGDGRLDIIAAGSDETAVWTSGALNPVTGVPTFTKTASYAAGSALAVANLDGQSPEPGVPLRLSAAMLEANDAAAEAITGVTDSRRGAHVTIAGDTVVYDASWSEVAYLLDPGETLDDSFSYRTASGTATVSLTLAGSDGATILTGGVDTASYSGYATGRTVLGLGGADTITGSNYADKLFGGTGQDVLNGGGGNDVLFGGAQADRLTGGAGADIFVFDRGQAQGDVVTDFARSQGDALVFRGYGTLADGASFAQISSTTWQITSADHLVTETITFSNGAQINPADFVFV